jgi:transglutaminase-like putative cysteine protease
VTTTLRPRPSPRARPPTEAPARGPAPPPAPRTPSPSPLVEVGAELALIAVSVSAVLSLARLFSSGAFLPPVLLAAVASHALAWICRHRGLGAVARAVLSGIGLVAAVAWLVEPHTTRYGIPGGATWTAMGEDLRLAWAQFGEVKAPAEPLRGFVLASVLAAWVMAGAADAFAFRMRARFEAMAPAFTLFVFASILGADRLRLATTALYLGSVLAFVLWSEAARRSGTGAWFAGRARDGDVAVLRQGTAMGLVALAVALIVGPHLPGAGSAGLVSWRDGENGRSRSRVTVSPLVDIRGRLVDQANFELFTVRADAASYWRLTSLERFDGTIWSSLGTYQSTKGALGGGTAVMRESARPLAQDYAIGALGSIWLPAAYLPDRVTGVKGARYDRDSSSVLAEANTADDLRYQVLSTQPQLTPAQLVAATGVIPDDVAERYLDLPEDFPPDVAAEARRQTQGATTAYEKAKALQDWFRQDFTYDTDISAGHDHNAMRRFLVARRGYCEQFAGTYAAMARVLGIPARVAVGFIPGDPFGDGRFHVAGRHAHAWPEVYLGGVGWVSFEPTPGRSSPGTEAYTGISPTPQDNRTETTTPTTTPSTTTPDTRPGPEEEEEASESSSAVEAQSGLSRWTVLLLTLVLLATVVGGGLPLARRWAVNRRRAAASTPSDRVLVAWQEAQEVMAQAGHRRRPWETAIEYAFRAGAVAGPAEPDLVRLAETSTVAGFSPEGVPSDAATGASRAAAAVARALRSRCGAVRRLWWSLDPRPIVAALRGRR